MLPTKDLAGYLINYKLLLYNLYLIITCTVKPVNKGHPREKQHMVFINKWPFLGGYTVLFYQGRVTEV